MWHASAHCTDHHRQPARTSSMLRGVEVVGWGLEVMGRDRVGEQEPACGSGTYFMVIVWSWGVVSCQAYQAGWQAGRWLCAVPGCAHICSRSQACRHHAMQPDVGPWRGKLASSTQQSKVACIAGGGAPPLPAQVAAFD